MKVLGRSHPYGPQILLSALTLLAAFFTSSPIPAQSVPDTSRLQLELWTETAPLADGLPGPELSQREIDEILATEARNLFSAMIYGYTFSYRPSDTARAIEEAFELRPLGILASTAIVAEKGYGLMALQSWRADNMARAILAYQCTAVEQIALGHWRRAEMPDTSGTGSWDYRDGSIARQKAFEMACKEAVRAYGRGLTRNKPMLMSGRFALAAAPRFRIDNGTWYVDVRVRIALEDIDAWKTW